MEQEPLRPQPGESMGRGYPVCGALYRFDAAPGVVVHLCPVECAKTGTYKGGVVAYVFGPHKTAEELLGSACAQDEVIPYIIQPARWFSPKGPYKPVGTGFVKHLPLHDAHVFYNKFMRRYADIRGLGYNPSPAEFASETLPTPIGLCERIAAALGLDIDCEALHGETPEQRALREKLPGDDYANSRSMYLAVRIPHADEALRDPDLDIMTIEDALIAALKAVQAGSGDGDEQGEDCVEIYLKVRPRKYPEAVRAIRQALVEVGVLKYEQVRGED